MDEKLARAVLDVILVKYDFYANYRKDIKDMVEARLTSPESHNKGDKRIDE